MPELKTPYPPKYHWIAEKSVAITDLWRHHIQNASQPDNYHRCYPLFVHNPTKLQFNNNLNTSGLVYDKATNELIMVILHNFTGHQNNMQRDSWFQTIYLTYSLHTELADPDKIVQLGVLAGAHSKPSLDRVRPGHVTNADHPQVGHGYLPKIPAGSWSVALDQIIPTGHGGSRLWFWNFAGTCRSLLCKQVQIIIVIIP